MTKILLLLPDGVGIRNFIYSNVLELLSQKYEVIIWHNLPDTTVQFLQEHTNNKVTFTKIPKYRENAPERLFRFAKVYGQLYGFYKEDNGSVTFKQLKPKKSIKGKLLDFTARSLGKIYKSLKGNAFLDKKHKDHVSKNKDLPFFENFLRQEDIKFVLCTNQRAALAVPGMVAAQKNNIPTCTFVYSWDNLPKGRMAVHADYYLVWSEHMKEELQKYYPEIANEKIHITGSPQFEPYFNQKLIRPRDVFLNELGLDANKPVICFSGGDVLTSPYDQFYLRDIAETLQSIPNEERPQIIFRPVPVDRSDRYDPILKKYKGDIFYSSPLWDAPNKSNEWNQVIPLPEDAGLLANLTEHCQAVINLGSTMGLDFSIKDAPAININYNNSEVDTSLWGIKYYYQVPHFKTVKALQPVYWINNKSEIKDVILNAIKNPDEKAGERSSWRHTLIKHPLDQASKRIANAVNDIVNKT